MNISNSIIKQNKNISTPNNNENDYSTLKSLKLSENKIINAEIISIKMDEITVKTNLGEVIKAKPLNIEGMKIGDLAKFLVKNLDGNILLKMQSNQELKSNSLELILKANDLKVSKENLILIETLISNNLPIDKNTFAKLNQITKMIGLENMEKAIFFLKNDIKTTSTNLNIIDDLTSGNFKLSEQIKELVQSIDNISDRALKNNLSTILINGEKALKSNSIINNIIEGLIENNNNKNKIIEAFNNKNLGIEKFKDLAKALNINFPENEKIINNLMKSKNNFIKNIENLPENIKFEIKEISKNNIPIENEKMLVDKKIEIISNKINQNNLIDKSFLKENEIKYLANALFNDKSQKEEKNEFLTRLKQYVEKTDFSKAELIEKLTFKFENNNSDKIDEFLNELKENISIVKKYISQESKLEDTSKLIRTIDKISNNIEFNSQIKNNLFLQLPIDLNNNKINSELFVFKDKTKKKAKNENVSALIALDTINIGRFETYLQKNNNSITCQFRLQDKEIEKLVRENINKLTTKLKSLNYSLDNISFKTLEQVFTLIDKEPMIEEVNNKISNEKLLSFDIST